MIFSRSNLFIRTMPLGWDPLNKAATISIVNDGRRAVQVNSDGFNNVKSKSPQSSGKYYVEISYSGGGTNGGGVPGVAVVIPTFTSNIFLSAGGGTTFLTYGEIRSDANSPRPESLPSWTAPGSVFCMAVDLDNRGVWGRVGSSGQWNGSGSANPATNTGGLPLGSDPGVIGQPVCIACAPFSVGQYFELNTRGGYVGLPPTGFYEWPAN
jgi:hypothetical protein